MIPNEQSSGPERRRRRVRLRGAFKGKRGKRLGLASAVVPLAGYLIQDLRKPDSVVKAIATRARDYLTERMAERRKRIDQKAQVEILDTTADNAGAKTDLLPKEVNDARRR